MACEACNAKFSFFTRKKQCNECLKYFCAECVIKRLDRILKCPTWKHNVNSPALNQVTDPDNERTNGSCEQKHKTDNTNVDCDAGAEISGTAVGTDESRTPVILTESETPVITDSQCSDTSNKVSTWSDGINLSDINTLSELGCLSVKQLKTLLSTNRVDYKGCTERYELLDKAWRLWQEYKQSKTNTETVDENLCKICWDEPIECVILECGHMVCCLNCGKQMSECPICKQYVVRVIRIFKA
nr:E3 ubiquitin-protein ligase rififylin [Nomia melanderi]